MQAESPEDKMLSKTDSFTFPYSELLFSGGKKCVASATSFPASVHRGLRHRIIPAASARAADRRRSAATVNRVFRLTVPLCGDESKLSTSIDTGSGIFRDQVHTYPPDSGTRLHRLFQKMRRDLRGMISQTKPSCDYLNKFRNVQLSIREN